MYILCRPIVGLLVGVLGFFFLHYLVSLIRYMVVYIGTMSLSL